MYKIKEITDAIDNEFLSVIVVVGCTLFSFFKSCSLDSHFMGKRAQGITELFVSS